MRERTDETLKTAFVNGSWETAPEGCPDTETLWASAAGELDSAADEALILHLARCPQCSSVWRLAREMGAAGGVDDGTVVSIEGVRRSKFSKRRVVLAFAAAVLIGVGLSTVMYDHRDVVGPPVYREQREDFSVSDSSEIPVMSRTDCRLRWKAGPDGSTYDLVVTDENLDVLVSIKNLSDPEYRIDPEDLPPSGEIFWRVTVHSPDGEVRSSETLTTRIEEAAGVR